MGATWIIAGSVLLVALALLALLGRKSVRSELTIHATPAEIWSVLTDRGSYSEWNPVLVRVGGDFEEGAMLSVETKNPDGSSSVFVTRVAQVVPDKCLNQAGGIPGLLTFDHTWRLEAVEGGTKVTQCEVFRGIGVLFVDFVWIGAAYRRAIIQLRNLVEARSHAQLGIEHRLRLDRPGLPGPSRQSPSPIHAGRG